MDDAANLMRIYLQDHHAGATIGVEVAKRSARSNQGNDFGTFLIDLERELEEDRQALERLMGRLGVKPAGYKQAAAWLAEKAGRLKLNGRITQYSDLSRVLELEGLLIGITGKLGLWRTLKETRSSLLDVSELEMLEARAIDQRDRVEERRLEAVRLAMSAPT